MAGTAASAAALSQVFVLGRDLVGVVAEDRGMSPPFRYYLTECCGASSKGLESYVGCRSCYAEVPPELGGCPDADTVLVKEEPARGGIRDDALGGWWVFKSVPLRLVAVYGDGLPYDEWKRRRCFKPAAGGWHCKPGGGMCTHPGGCLLGPDGVRRG